MNSRSTLGLSILAGGLAFVGTAHAVELLKNGSFELGSGDPDFGWVGTFGTYNYTQVFWGGPPVPASENPGTTWSWRHGLPDGTFDGPLTQEVNLSPAVSEADLDAGRGNFTFSAWMASYTANPDRPYVTLQFFGTSTNELGTLVALDRTSSVNFRVFADGTTTFDRAAHEHHWAKYVARDSIPAGARRAIVGVTRSPNAAVSGRPDTYTDLVKLDVSASAFLPPAVISSAPGGANVRPDSIVRVVLQDGSTQINTNSLQMTFDGAPVVPSVTRVGNLTTITFDPPGLMASDSAHTARLIAADNGSPATRLTNTLNFTVLSYYDIALPTAIHLETFDTTAEGSLPAGWSSQAFLDMTDPNVDLSDLHSAAYAKWTVVDSTRFSGPLLTYATHTPETDYQRVLSPNGANVVNGAVVDPLAQGKIVFGNSGYRQGGNGPNGSQILYLFSKDFDLTGRNNVYLSFHSIWEQNQDSIGAVEYSIDEGATWLPVVYYLDPRDFVLDVNGAIDPVATLSSNRADIAVYEDPGTLDLRGGFYGAFIGVDSNRWSTLAPFLAGRTDDDSIGSKRVEVFRLPAADGQAKVRLRFAHAGADSWYFGADNIGFYSLTTVNPPVVQVTATGSTAGVGNSTAFAASARGIGPFTYQWRKGGTAIPGATNATLTLRPVQSADAGDYSLVVGYPSGTVERGPFPLTVINPPSLVVGQWDFDGGLGGSCGRALEFANTQAEIDSGFTLGDINLETTGVLQFTPTVPFSGYRMYPNVPGNGGGTNLNQYTLIMDVIYPSGSAGFRALIQSNPDNTNDAEFFISPNQGLGINGVYQGTVAPDAWHRIALAVDLAGPGPSPIVAKFIDGVKVGEQRLPAGLDSNFSLPALTSGARPYALLFADNDGDVQSGSVSSVQLRTGRLPDAAISALGGPSAKKIPGCITAGRDGTNVVIRWTGGVPLQSANEVTGPWSDVSGATSPLTLRAPLAARRFFRPKLL